MSNDSIIIERTYNARAERVWQALTDPEQMRQWYMKEINDFKAEPGFATRFVISYEGRDFPHLWKVEEVVQGKKISYEWKYEGYPGTSLVSFELFAEGEQTRIVLTHTGIASFMPEQYPELSKENHEMGWNELIGVLLKDYVEKQ